GRSSPARYAFVATYATFGSTFDGSIRTTHCPRAGSGKLFVSSAHLPPSFSVIHSRPSSVPAQSSPAFFGDSASENTTPYFSPRRRPPSVCSDCFAFGPDRSKDFFPLGPFS